MAFWYNGAAGTEECEWRRWGDWAASGSALGTNRRRGDPQTAARRDIAIERAFPELKPPRKAPANASRLAAGVDENRHGVCRSASSSVRTDETLLGRAREGPGESEIGRVPGKTRENWRMASEVAEYGPLQPPGRIESPVHRRRQCDRAPEMASRSQNLWDCVNGSTE
jgi:hypothetical protein